MNIYQFQVQRNMTINIWRHK